MYTIISLYVYTIVYYMYIYFLPGPPTNEWRPSINAQTPS